MAEYAVVKSEKLSPVADIADSLLKRMARKGK
jgi:hypothetical protein